MGGCCSSESAQEGQLELEVSNSGVVSPTQVTQIGKLTSGNRKHASSMCNPTAGQSDYNIAFVNKLAAGMPVLILLATGSGLECSIKLESEVPGRLNAGATNSDLKLVLTRDRNKREIPFATITKILNTPEQLMRVETASNLDSNCCAVLMSSGTCITLRWDSVLDCRAFVTEMAAILSEGGKDSQ